MDAEICIEAIKKYITSKDFDLNKLYRYVTLLRVKDKVKVYLEVLL